MTQAPRATEPRIRVLVIDDEPLARENLRIRLRGVEDFALAAECANGREALEKIASERPDVVFLDIQMPDLGGFDVIERIPPELQPVIVFVTAYDQYALEAFRVHALDYLLKPFDDERLAEALQACRERVREGRRAESAAEAVYQLAGDASERAPAPAGDIAGTGRALPDRLVIKARGRVFFIKIDAVDWVEANGDYARLHSGERSYLVRRTMNEMETRLDRRLFVRISRSSIVQLDRIRDLVPAARGEYLVRLTTGPELKLTRGYRGKLESRLADRL